jgi:D-arabinose 1-dehydrogenase-like Zn-dependent alcohol dehydrogenase
LAAIHDELADEDAAPLLCAGITTYNALRNSGARGGDLVAILGVGGLGHLGIQFAAKLGFRTVAIARGTDKEQLARELGAHAYIDSTAGNPGEALQKMGGAKVILSTISSGEANTKVIERLARRGELIVVGASPDPIEASPGTLIGGNLTISGHAKPSPSRKPARPTPKCLPATPGSAWSRRPERSTPTEVAWQFKKTPYYFYRY